MTDNSGTMVERVVLICNAFKGAHPRLSLPDVVAATGLPRSSVHRILQQLTAAGWLERDGSLYRLGLGIFELGTLVAHRDRLRAVSRPFLQELSGGRYVAHLAVVDGRDVVYLDKLGGGLAGKLPSRVGGRLPAHCTGVGKAILAFSEPHVLDTYLERGLVRKTSTTIGDPETLLTEFVRIRDRGVAFDEGEAVPGIACVAAPVFERGVVRAAVSVCAQASKLDINAMRNHVLSTATSISRRLSEDRGVDLVSRLA